MTPNEETGRRFCMLSEFMFGKPVLESYKSLCSKIGDETISYQEFDFWFHRFAQGKLDLSYDRSLDPKPKELSDMPIHVVDNILDHLSLMERLPIRNVSRDFRDLIDKRTDSVKRIYFGTTPDYFIVATDNLHTFYNRIEWETFQDDHNEYNDVLCTVQKVHRTIIEGPDVEKKALKHLAYYLRNPKLELEYFFVGDRGDGEECLEKLEALMLSLEHQISIKTFHYYCVSEYFFLAALKSFKPGVLEVMKGEAYWSRYEDYDVMDEIVKTESWKKAKQFMSRGSIESLVDGVAHFEEFTMRWDETEPENVIRLKQLLLESKTFKKGELTFWNLRTKDLNAAIDRIVEALGPRIFRDPENPRKWSYPIPDSNEFLDFQNDRHDGFFIERTT